MFYVAPSIKNIECFIYFSLLPPLHCAVTNGRPTQLEKNLENCQEITVITAS